MKNKIFILPFVLYTCLHTPLYASDCIDDECDNVVDLSEYEFEEISQDVENLGTAMQRLNSDDIDDVELVELYNETMNDAATTRDRIEKILARKDRAETKAAEKEEKKDDGINIKTSIFMPNIVWDVLNAAVTPRRIIDDCPFKTPKECDIWRRKPLVREIVSPRSPKLSGDKMASLMLTLESTDKLDVNSPVASPLIERYRALMRMSNACCTDGMTYALRRAGASAGLVYKFLSDDANFYSIGERCMMMTDSDIDANYPNEASTAAMVSDVRNRCLCKSRDQIHSLLAPFMDAWDTSPKFAASPFLWTYVDGLSRSVTISINRDVQFVMDQLAQCP